MKKLGFFKKKQHEVESKDIANEECPLDLVINVEDMLELEPNLLIAHKSLFFKRKINRSWL